MHCYVELILAWWIQVPIQCIHVLWKRMASKDQEYVIGISHFHSCFLHMECSFEW